MWPILFMRHVSPLLTPPPVTHLPWCNPQALRLWATDGMINVPMPIITFANMGKCVCECHPPLQLITATGVQHIVCTTIHSISWRQGSASSLKSSVWCGIMISSFVVSQVWPCVEVVEVVVGCCGVAPLEEAAPSIHQDHSAFNKTDIRVVNWNDGARCCFSPNGRGFSGSLFADESSSQMTRNPLCAS